MDETKVQVENDNIYKDKVLFENDSIKIEGDYYHDCTDEDSFGTITITTNKDIFSITGCALCGALSFYKEDKNESNMEKDKSL